MASFYAHTGHIWKKTWKSTLESYENYPFRTNEMAMWVNSLRADEYNGRVRRTISGSRWKFFTWESVKRVKHRGWEMFGHRLCSGDCFGIPFQEWTHRRPPRWPDWYYHRLFMWESLSINDYHLASGLTVNHVGYNRCPERKQPIFRRWILGGLLDKFNHHGHFLSNFHIGCTTHVLEIFGRPYRKVSLLKRPIADCCGCGLTEALFIAYFRTIFGLTHSGLTERPCGIAVWPRRPVAFGIL